MYSALKHKEFRFIFPVVPFACMYAGNVYTRVRLFNLIDYILGYHLHTLWTKYKHWGNSLYVNYKNIVSGRLYRIEVLSNNNINK